MAHHVYIDESGTLDYQEVMTVAAVVVEGRFTAHAIHKEAAMKINPKWFDKTKRTSPIEFHYADMLNDHKRSLGAVFGSKKIECFSSCFYHDGTEKSGTERFAIYTQLVRSCLIQAFDVYDNLTVVIERQGGWDFHKPALLSALRDVPEHFKNRGKFCVAKIELKPGTKPGLQLADFYAGATRDFLLSYKDSSLSDPYQLIEHQVRDIKVEAYENTAKTKG